MRETHARAGAQQYNFWTTLQDLRKMLGLQGFKIAYSPILYDTVGSDEQTTFCMSYLIDKDLTFSVSGKQI